MNLAAELGVGALGLNVCDVGAAFYSELPPYQPLIDDGLVRLFAFEPDASQHARLRSILPPGASLLPYALGDGGRHDLHVAPAGMASLLEPDPEAYAFYSLFHHPQLDAARQAQNRLPVDTRRLDDVAEIERIDLLKIDIQGAELMVLQHGRDKLRGCSVIQIEAPYVRLYKDQPTLGELDAELSAQGFMVHGFGSIKRLPVAPWGAHGLTTGINQLVDLDLIYIRDFIRPQTLSDEVLRRTAVIVDRCYNSGDLALRAIVELERRGAAAAGLGRRYFEAVRDRKGPVTLHAVPAVRRPLDAGPGAA